MKFKRLSSALMGLVAACVLATASFAADNEKNIVDTAVAAGNFKTLATALEVAGLVDTLKEIGPYTVLAPTDEAFAKIPKDQLDSILADKELLTKILTYHVVRGKIMAEDIVKMTEAITVEGQAVTVHGSAAEPMINNAKVIATDIEASNGVIHAIDTVLIPK